MFFDGWSGLWRTLVVGVLAYVALVALLRVSGKRTLSKMNAFDLIVTVALGSTLATILLSKDVALAEGITALIVLIGMQYLVAWLSVRSPTVGTLVKSEPRLLFYQGQFLHNAMRDERVVEAEVTAAIRQQGIATLQEAEAVVLETDGSFTVVKQDNHANQTALDNVSGYDRHTSVKM
jgi:uncharacterized membrane protein YcaP (DUF421 family)